MNLESSGRKKDKREGSKLWDELRELQECFENHTLSEENYVKRKNELVDLLTNTSLTALTDQKGLQFDRHYRKLPQENWNSPPPIVNENVDWSSIPIEHALIYDFDLLKNQWTKSTCSLQLSSFPHAKGSNRLVYTIRDTEGVLRRILPQRLNEPCTLEEAFSRSLPSTPLYSSQTSSIAKSIASSSCSQDIRNVSACQVVYIPTQECSLLDDSLLIGKCYIDPFIGNGIYFHSVELQSVCEYYASLFNQCNPPHYVRFVKTCCVELIDRPCHPLLNVEPFIQGDYRKHNNNYGYVDESIRNTPQCFSHFTYEISDHELIVVDIQGVGDVYTDPQIHSVNGCGFAEGNMGLSGIEEFAKSHSCNPICEYMKLPVLNTEKKPITGGTVPSQRQMSFSSIPIKNNYSRIGIGSETIERLKDETPDSIDTCCCKDLGCSSF